MSDQSDFDKTIDGWVSARLGESLRWDSLLYALPSVYPASVWESVRRLSLTNKIRFPEGRSRSADVPSFALDLWRQEKLLTPHPLDSSWWFADAALERLLECLRSLTEASDAVLLLGTPTLFHYAKERRLGRSTMLVDRECTTAAEDSFHAARSDLMRDLPLKAKFDVIVADPPWYPLEMRAFLDKACRNAKKGTKVLLSVPGLGTRPGVQGEWSELLRWAESAGLRLLEYEEGVLPYISPLFERNALRAAGVESCPEDWRRGDLAMFEYDGVRAEQGSLAVASRDSWKEVRFGSVRICIRPQRYAGWNDPRPCQIVAGDVLPSVSRRDKRLSSVAAWTSGNRVFACEGTFALWKIAESLKARDCPAASLASEIGRKLEQRQAREVEEAAKKLTEVIEVEEQEIADWRNKKNDNVVELPAR
jgi:putative N6-adenine methyltransferase